MPDELTADTIGVTKIPLLQKPPRGIKFYEPTELTDELNLVVGLIQDGTEISLYHAFGHILPATGRIPEFHRLETCAAGRTKMAGCFRKIF